MNGLFESSLVVLASRGVTTVYRYRLARLALVGVPPEQRPAVLRAVAQVFGFPLARLKAEEGAAGSAPERGGGLHPHRYDRPPGED